MNYNYGVRKKSVVSVILLTFITCGIYTFFWMYQTTKELAEYSGIIVFRQKRRFYSRSLLADCTKFIGGTELRMSLWGHSNERICLVW